MRANDHLQTELRRNEVTKVGNMRTRRITDEHSRGKVYDLGSVFLHLFRSGFDVPTWAPVARGKSNELNLVVLVHAECPFLAVQRTEAFSTGAGMVAMTNDDSDPGFLAHDVVLSVLIVHSLEISCYGSNGLQSRHQSYRWTSMQSFFMIDDCATDDFLDCIINILGVGNDWLDL